MINNYKKTPKKALCLFFVFFIEYKSEFIMSLRIFLMLTFSLADGHKSIFNRSCWISGISLVTYLMFTWVNSLCKSYKWRDNLVDLLNK